MFLARIRRPLAQKPTCRKFIRWFGDTLEDREDPQGIYQTAVDKLENWRKGEDKIAMLTEAIQLMREAAEKGNAPAQTHLSEILDDEGYNEIGTPSEADSLLISAADANYTEAMYRAALKFIDGRLPQIRDKVEGYLLKAHEAGHELASLELGKYYWNRKQQDKSYQYWAHVYNNSETLEHIGMASCSLGHSYILGCGVPQSPKKALECWRKHPNCDPSGRTHFNIGLCYMTGDGTEIDCNAAIHYFKEAESRGYACWQRIEDCMKMREGLLCPPVEYYSFVNDVLALALEKMKFKLEPVVEKAETE